MEGEASAWPWDGGGDGETDPEAQRTVVTTVEMHETRIRSPGSQPPGRRGDAHHAPQEEPQGNACSSPLSNGVTPAHSGDERGCCAERCCHRQTPSGTGHLAVARYAFGQR
jgi:hypothetical protein